MDMRLTVKDDSVFLSLILIALGIWLAYMIARRFVFPRMAAKYGAPPRFLRRFLKTPFFGPLVHSMLPRAFVGADPPPVVRLLRFAGALVVILALANVVAMSGFLLERSPSMEGISGEDTGFALRFGESNVGGTTAYMFVVVGLAALLFTLFDWKRRMRHPLTELGLSVDRAALRGVGVGILVGFALVGLYVSAAVVLGGLRYHRVANGNVLSPWIVTGCLLIVAMWEEVVFRGYALQALRMQYGARKAIVVTSVIFALIHVQYFGSGWWQAIGAATAILALGAFFATIRLASGTLWIPIAIHFVWNTAAWALGELGAVFAPAASPWLERDYTSASRILVGTPESGGILDLLVMMVALALAWWWFHDHPGVAAGPTWTADSECVDPAASEADLEREAEPSDA